MCQCVIYQHNDGALQNVPCLPLAPLPTQPLLFLLLRSTAGFCLHPLKWLPQFRPLSNRAVKKNFGNMLSSEQNCLCMCCQCMLLHRQHLLSSLEICTLKLVSYLFKIHVTGAHSEDNFHQNHQALRALFPTAFVFISLTPSTSGHFRDC